MLIVFIIQLIRKFIELSNNDINLFEVIFFLIEMYVLEIQNIFG